MKINLLIRSNRKVSRTQHIEKQRHLDNGYQLLGLDVCPLKSVIETKEQCYSCFGKTQACTFWPSKPEFGNYYS